jgi:hypothetical protein
MTENNEPIFSVLNGGKGSCGYVEFKCINDNGDYYWNEDRMDNGECFFPGCPNGYNWAECGGWNIGGGGNSQSSLVACCGSCTSENLGATCTNYAYCAE